MRSHRILLAAAVLVAFSLPARAGGTSPSPPSSYPSCGLYWNKNQPPSAAQLRKNACLLSARWKGGKARLVAVRSTIEGDPIVSYVYVNGKMPVLLVEDTRRDRFGAGGWSQTRCTRLGASGGFLTFGGCRVLGRGRPSWLKPIKLPG